MLLTQHKHQWDTQENIKQLCLAHKAKSRVGIIVSFISPPDRPANITSVFSSLWESDGSTMLSSCYSTTSTHFTNKTRQASIQHFITTTIVNTVRYAHVTAGTTCSVRNTHRLRTGGIKQDSLMRRCKALCAGSHDFSLFLYLCCFQTLPVFVPGPPLSHFSVSERSTGKATWWEIT